MENEPITREEILLNAVAVGKAENLEPITREEMFLAKLGGADVTTPIPITRKEKFLQKAIEGGGSGGGGGSVEGVHYVTFMSEDGTVELGKKAVATGDDCADPIARGVFPTPTKESTAQYNYTFYGWATTPNGAADSNWNKAVTEDRTVYANFASVVRYYTITYYDSDGTTVLKTDSLAYGATPNYIPSKDGDYSFGGWVPSLTPVTGAAAYTAVWEEKANFATSSWAKIKEICDAGNASNYFKVGDKRPITLSYTDGTSETIQFTIIDMGVDTKDDGTPAALTIMADNLVKNSLQPASKKTNQDYFTHYDNAATFFAELLSALPGDLQEVIAPVRKNQLYSNLHAKIFIPSQQNLENKTNSNGSYTGNMFLLPQVQYKYFKNGASINRTKLGNSAADDYWTSTVFNMLSSGVYGVWVDGGVVQSSSNILHSASHGIVPCFCI